MAQGTPRPNSIEEDRMWTLGLGRNPASSRPVAAMTIAVEPGSGCETETIATSQLGSSVVLKGQLAASEDLTIEGHFEGTIEVKEQAISEFPKWRKYLILLSFLDNSSARPVQIGGVDVNICHSRSTAVRGRRRSSSQSPPRGPFCRTRTGPVEADGAVDAQNAPTAPWKTLCVFHELPQGLSHQVTHEKLRKAPKYRWEIRIDPKNTR